MRNRWKSVVVILSFALSMFGCAFGTDYVKVNSYKASTPAEKPGSGVVVYMTTATDDRSQPEMVGQKAAGYVALEKGQDLKKIVTDSVADCLSSYGYIVKKVDNMDAVMPEQGQTAKVLNTSIEEFWTSFVGGFWTVDANAKALFAYELVEKGSNATLWKKKIGKGAKDSSAFGATPGLFEKSLNMVLAEEMQGLSEAISSADFKNALAQKNPAAAAVDAH